MKILKSFFEKQKKRSLIKTKKKAFSSDFNGSYFYKKCLKMLKEDLHIEYICRCNYELMVSGASKPYSEDDLNRFANSAIFFIIQKHDLTLL